MTKVDVLYNADCPVCSREMNHYAQLSSAQALPFRYDDLNDPALLDTWGISADDAAKRLHVRKDGQLFRGIPAFIVLWQSLPNYGWLAKTVSLPVIRQLANWFYDRVLAPYIYRRHLRRLAKGAVKDRT